MQLQQHKLPDGFKGGWFATLSSGETIYEKEKPSVPGELSCWQQLLDRLKSGEKITELHLIRGNCHIVTMRNSEVFQGYLQRHSMKGLTNATFQGIGTVADDMVFITWTDGRVVYQDTRNLSEVWSATTVRAREQTLAHNIN